MPSTFKLMWNVKEPKHYSKREGGEFPRFVADLCVVDKGPMLIAVSITEMVIPYNFVKTIIISLFMKKCLPSWFLYSSKKYLTAAMEDGWSICGSNDNHVRLSKTESCCSINPEVYELNYLHLNRGKLLWTNDLESLKNMVEMFWNSKESGWRLVEILSFEPLRNKVELEVRNVVNQKANNGDNDKQTPSS